MFSPKSLKKTLLAATFCLASILPLNSKTTCGGGDYDYFYGSYVYFAPESAPVEEYKPFYFTFDRWYDYSYLDQKYKYKDNISEWREYLGNTPSREAIEEVLYNYDAEGIQDMDSWIRNNKGGAKVSGNEMVKALKEKKDVDALNYIRFAKKCEKFCYAPSDWDFPERNEYQMSSLIEEGKERIKSASSTFLKLRYGYQVVRLAHYAGKYEDAIKYYDSYVAGIAGNSVIAQWALGHKAGALMETGKRTEANYLFSTLFDKCPSKRINFYYSFGIEDDREFQKVLNLCKNNREKTTLYLMRAIDPNSRSVEEMENIYKLDPTSDYLTLLLVREVNKVEAALMDADFTFEYPIKVKKTQYDDGTSTEEDLKYLANLSRFVAQKVSEGKVKNLAAWKLAQGYLAYLSGDFAQAQAHFTAAANENKSDNKLQEQGRIFNFMLRLAQLKKIDAATEESIWKEYKGLNFPQRQESQKPDYHEGGYSSYKSRVEKCIAEVTHRLYENQGEKGKAFLANQRISDLMLDPEEEVVDDLILWADKSHSTFEKEFLMDGNPSDFKPTMQEMKGTLLLRRGKLAEAKAIFENLPQSYKTAESFLIKDNPFNARINDCHECAEEKYANDKEKTKLWMVSKMLEMQQKGSAVDYLLLGNAWYNTTFFGSSWRAIAYARSGGDWYFDDPSTEDDYYYPSMYYNHTDLSLAKEAYEKALNAAGTDRETAAKATFMLAKCKLMEKYMFKATQKDVDAYYTKLAKEYSDTKYYKEALKECFYFSYFVSK